MYLCLLKNKYLCNIFPSNLATRFFFIAWITLLFSTLPAFGQQNDEEEEGKKDTSIVYKKIKEVAYKRKLTRFIYEAVFTDSSSGPTISPIKKDNYNKYKGKIVRNIEIITLDPLGTSVNETDRVVNRPLVKAVNKVHIKSKKVIIKNLLLLKKGYRVDPLSVRESERILRRTGYIRDAKISIHSIPNNKDSVDITVVVQNLWSLLLIPEKDGPYYKISLKETNMIGLGHAFQNNLVFRPDSFSRAVLNGSYSIPNIKKTFITATLYYSNSSAIAVRGISLERAFFSPLTRWAGGGDEVLVNSINPYLPDTTHAEYQLQYRKHDYWIGRSFKIHPGNTDEERTSRLVLTARFLNTHYNKKPLDDTSNIFQNSTFYLGSVGYSSSSYYKDNYIFRFAVNEDVPEGRLFALIGGVEDKELSLDYYVGAKASMGKHYGNAGYISAKLEYGTFLTARQPERGVVNFDFSFISDRLMINKYGIRQFIYYHVTQGIDRAHFEHININGNKGLYGFESKNLIGKSKMYLNLQSVIYTPWNLIGFQFAPVLFAGFGVINNTSAFNLKGPIYQVFGIGLLIRNENLIINSFRFSFAFYSNQSNTPGIDYRINPFGAYDLRFNDFFLSKPAPISYQ